MKLGEFFISLIVDAEKGELTLSRLVSSMGELQAVSVGEIAVLAELARKLEGVAQAAIKNAGAFAAYSTATGASTEKLQEWQAVASHLRIPKETMEGALRRVSADLYRGEMSGDYGSLRNIAGLLHLNLKEFKGGRPTDFLQAIRDSPEFKRMALGIQNQALGTSGIGDIMAVLTNKGPLKATTEEWNEWSKEALGMTRQDIKDYQHIYSEFQSIENIVEQIGLIIAGWFKNPLASAVTWEKDRYAELRDELRTYTADPKQFLRDTGAVGKYLLLDFPEELRKENRLPRYNSSGMPVFDFGSLPPLSPSATASPVQHKTEVHVDHKVTINGSKLDERQLEAAITRANEKMLVVINQHTGNAPT